MADEGDKAVAKDAVSTKGADDSKSHKGDVAVEAKEAKPAPQEAPVSKQKKQGLKDTMRGICHFIWNAETHEVMGRGGRRWALLFVFYVLFYAAIACFFTSLLMLMFSSLKKEVPWMIYKVHESDYDKFIGRSLIQKWPSVIFTPVGDREKNPDSDLIWLNKNTAPVWGKKLKDRYDEHNERKKHCTGCFEPAIDAVQCSNETNFGYGTETSVTRIQPTFMVRLSKVLKYEPKGFATENDLTAYIKKEIDCPIILTHAKQLIQDIGWTAIKDNILVVCQGDSDADNQLAGPIQYCNSPVINKDFYPYKNQPKDKNSLAPFVMLKFPNPTPGIPITIACYPLIKGQNVDKKKSYGIEKMEFMIN